ncbi:MAG: hypothetical protein RLZZ385_396 [Pseudomonadota bacterium]|jgi:gamma-glutamylcyclotransferase (GGCT)/AIG2-like uncharacterized protein YtfP
MALERLFVYGSLAPGRSHHHLLAGLRGQWQPAKVRGSLYPRGWGPTKGWPALRLDPHGAEVPGFLLESRDLSRRWAALDRFEGPAYRRVIATVGLGDGTRIEAYVYEQKRLPRLGVRSSSTVRVTHMT